jgi:hypothetical protein
MNKRLAAAALWFYAGWTFGAFVAMALGFTALLGPILGAAAALTFVGDPRRVIWTTRSEVANSGD